MTSEYIPFRYILAVFIILTFIHGCVKEDIDECADEALLYITVVDLLSGLDITDEEEVGDVDLFIFDPVENYIDRVTVPKEKLLAGEPIPIKHTDTKGIWVSAWGNLKDGQIVPLMADGRLLSAETIMLKTGEDGFALCPDDLFFGVKQINLEHTTRAVTIIREELPISRKNARMHITVLGLPDVAFDDDYYFTVQGGYNGYNFRGDPMAGDFEVRQTGGFNLKREFATADVFNMIHCVEGDNNVTVNLYRKEGDTRAASLVASVTEDTAGVCIAPLAGETTNVLIDLRGANVSVSIEQTPWNEVYNWVSW